MVSRRAFLAATAALATPVRAVTSPPCIRFGQIGIQHAHASGKMEALRRLNDLYEVVGLSGDEETKSETYAGSPRFTTEDLLAVSGFEGAICIVSDIQLPGMSGLDLLSELRGRGVGTPVILITAHDGPDVQKEAERRGAAAYLAKPFLGSAMLAAIGTARATG